MAEDTPLSLHTTVGSAVVEDLKRARELYRHVQPHHFLPNLPDWPNNTRNTETAASALRDALEPYVQLAALRCNAQRAFITLIDRDSQYFIAEASKILDANSNEIFEEHEQLLWLGCEGVPKSGKLCEMTIQLPPSEDSYPLFEVNDLAQDARFCHLPFVHRAPYFRFYAGTPMTSRRGINIGSLCIMDVEPRQGLTKKETHVLAWLAGLVMAHLETNREAMEGRRSKLMSNALNVFVDGRSRMKPSAGHVSRAESVRSDGMRRNRTPSKRNSRTFSHNGEAEGEIKFQEMSSNHREIPFAEIEEGTKEDSQGSTNDQTTASSDPNSEEEDFRINRQDEVASESHRSTFGRAANILRECFEMEHGDGVFFLEAGTGLTHTTGSRLATSNRQEFPDNEEARNGQDDAPISPTHHIGTNTSFDPLISAFAKHAKNPAPVLAASTKHEPFLRGPYPAGRPALGDIDQDILRELFKRYPKGKIWVQENNGIASASEDDTIEKHVQRPSPQRRKRSRHRKGEASVMARLFPEVRQILFVPLWDAGASRWASGCFIWSTSETRVFSTTVDLGFLSAFGTTMMAECSRLDTLLADKQKADFIGSISHELRSPLHGILAGAEFLSETATSAFQGSLIETVQACGRTLLDTINHVLDFSKINSLDRNWRNNRPPRKGLSEGQIGPGARMSAKQLPSEAPPLLRLYAVTDIAAVTEEVVEGLSVGQIYSQATDLTDISATNRGRGAGKGFTSNPKAHGGGQDGKKTTGAEIDVLLDISREDWVFMAQPGAIRRIIMNLFGNSIKYTSSGTIKVQLRLETIPGLDPEHDGNMMVLIVSDTGKGIAANFLSSRLFVPFAQENTLSPGTGLGLSLVRSIVTMMGGNIDLQSKLGEGTTVQVCLPLMRPLESSASSHSTPRSTSTGATRDDPCQTLRDEAVGCSVSIHEHSENNLMGASSLESAKVLASYVRDWYGLKVCDWADRSKANILIVEENDLPVVLDGAAEVGLEGNPALIVLCSNATRHSEAEADASESQLKGVFEYLSKPCGPYKLARALRACLGKMRLLNSTHLPGIQESVTSSPSQAFRELDLPDLQEKEASTSVQANGTILASQFTQNAQMAINDRFAGEKASEHEFPFPSQRSCSIVSPSSPDAQNLSKWTKVESEPSVLPEIEDRRPRILLVDDNKINLQLLQTFMRKQKYDLVDSAEDGNIAVNAVKAAKEPYDIIFMDISMPVMNGFEATRAIRSYEVDNKLKPAMIIALTGLANARDQTEGFSSGCDIYMTKPVSFKELGKLLKNWEGNMDDAVRSPEQYHFVTLRGALAKERDAD